eukprot:6487229-Amphidinium_carterae.2
MLDSQGYLKLIDFGIAKKLGDSRDVIPPEQFLSPCCKLKISASACVAKFKTVCFVTYNYAPVGVSIEHHVLAELAVLSG